MDKLVTVIVPVYKVEAYLEKCLESILKQTYSKLDIILVDDGSPDRCGIICDQWAEKDPRIRVIHKENGGLSYARNAGLDLAKGDYILFVDSDDWIEATLVEEALTAILAADADICSFGICSYYGDRQEKWNTPAFTGDSETALALLYQETLLPVAAWNKLYKRVLWENLRFPVGKLYEDAFTTYILLDHADKIIQIDKALYCYRSREGSIMKASFSERFMDAEEAWRSNYEYMKLHHPALAARAFDFYLQKVRWIYRTIPKEEVKTYQKQYRFLRNILRENLVYILFKCSMRPKLRIRFLLDYLAS